MFRPAGYSDSEESDDYEGFSFGGPSRAVSFFPLFI